MGIIVKLIAQREMLVHNDRKRGGRQKKERVRSKQCVYHMSKSTNPYKYVSHSHFASLHRFFMPGQLWSTAD